MKIQYENEFHEANELGCTARMYKMKDELKELQKMFETQTEDSIRSTEEMNGC